MRRSLAMLALVLTVAVGCGRGDEGRSEATRVTRVVNAAIAADEDEKAQASAVVAAEPCSRADLCETRDRCAAAFKTMGEGYALRKDVHAGMAGGGGADAPALAAKLDQAQAKTDAARAQLDACRQSLAAAERKYSP